MSEYDNELKGVLFQNDKRETDKHPHMKGSCTIEGKEYWLSAWSNVSQAGAKYLSLSLTPKDETRSANGTGASQKSDSKPFDDDLPF